MALNAAIQWNIRQDATAGNVNGGGYKTGATGSDASRGTVATWPLTTLATNATSSTTVNYASADPVMVGNVGHLTGGSGSWTVGWFEVTSVVASTTITFDRNVATNVGTNGIMNIGGSIGLGSVSSGSGDGAFFAAVAAGNTMWVQNVASVSLAQAVTITAGAATTKTVLDSYTNVRGDAASTSSLRGTMNVSNGLTTGTNTKIQNLIMRSEPSSAGTMVTLGAASVIYNCKITHRTTSGGTTAVGIATNSGAVIDSEIQSYRGTCVTFTASGLIRDNYLHHSNIAVTSNINGQAEIQNNLIEACTSGGVNSAASDGFALGISGNTFYGLASQAGTGITNNASKNTFMFVFDNNFVGWTAAISNADNWLFGNANANYNNFWNCGSTYAGAAVFPAGPQDSFVNPNFVNVSEIVVNNAVGSGNTITSSGTNLLQVNPVTDYLYVASGLGYTAGYYGILSIVGSTSVITLDINGAISSASNAPDKTYFISMGHNFLVGSSTAASVTKVYPGGLTTSYQIAGATSSNFTKASAGGAKASTFVT